MTIEKSENIFLLGIELQYIPQNQLIWKTISGATIQRISSCHQDEYIKNKLCCFAFQIKAEMMQIEIVVYVFDEIFIDQQEFIRNFTKFIIYFSKCINDRDGIYNLNRLALGSSFAAFVAAVFFVDFFTEILSCS